MEKSTIKKILIKDRGHKCFKCQNKTWMDFPIPLEIHHIDGNSKNDDFNNIQLLCPNCHTLTPNYKGKNKKKQIFSKVSDDVIKEIIPNCQSIKELLKIVGLSTGLPNYNRVRKIMTDFNLKLKPRELSILEIESKIKQRKINRPSKDELKNLIWSKPMTKLSEELKVSDKSISKWCDFYGIETPPRGYWIKLS